MNIYLVGYRGTGKTSVAPILNMLLNYQYQFVDMDHLIEHRAGRTIAEIFQAEGEAGFRDREQALLAELNQHEHLIVATGGGVIEREANRKLLAGALVAWLRAPAEVIAHRLQGDPTTAARRPALTSKSTFDEIEEILTRREPLYRSVARWEIDASSRPPFELAGEIMSRWRDDILSGKIPKQTSEEPK